MVTIKAKGIYERRGLEVVCAEQDGKMIFLFNNHKETTTEKKIRAEMKKRHVMAGTFSPEEDSMLNVLNVLQHHFFDEPPEIETTGEFPEMPGELGVVY